MSYQLIAVGCVEGGWRLLVLSAGRMGEESGDYNLNDELFQRVPNRILCGGCKTVTMTMRED